MEDDFLLLYENYFDITRTSGEAKVNCVLHDDAHASASVNLDNGLWNCYVCNKGGDAITLVMEAESLKYRDALRFAENVVASSGGEVRSRTTFERYGYGLPVSSRNKRRGRKYVPSWRRG